MMAENHPFIFFGMNHCTRACLRHAVHAESEIDPLVGGPVGCMAARVGLGSFLDVMKALRPVGGHEDGLFPQWGALVLVGNLLDFGEVTQGCS